MKKKGKYNLNYKKIGKRKNRENYFKRYKDLMKLDAT